MCRRFREGTAENQASRLSVKAAAGKGRMTMNQRKYAKVGGSSRGKTDKKALRVQETAGAPGKETAGTENGGLPARDAAGRSRKSAVKGNCGYREKRGRGSAGACGCGENWERENMAENVSVGAETGRRKSVCTAWNEWDEVGGGGRKKNGDLAEEAPLSWEDWAELPLEGYDEDLVPDRDRAFSRQTVYLVHKWLAEGMPLPMVARMLNRSEENVRAAAEVPLLKGEKALMERYFFPFRMRKETE